MKFPFKFRKTIKKIWFAIVAILAISVIFSPVYTLAQGQEAADKCKKELNFGNSQHDQKLLDACKQGYSLGKDNKSKAFCQDNYGASSDETKACEDGYKLGGGTDKGKPGDPSKTNPDDPCAQSGPGCEGEYICGTYSDDSRNVHTKFDFGCIGTEFEESGKGAKNLSPVLDFVYAIVRFLSVGVGIVVVISIILAGIQYASSEGNPETSAAAKRRIQNTLIALFIYIFAFAILQYLVPGGWI